MDWEREHIAKWLWHAYNGFVESEKEKNPGAVDGFIDVSQLKVSTTYNINYLEAFCVC